MSNSITTVKEYLATNVERLKQQGIQHSGINGYFCLMDFIFQEGREWKPGTVCLAKGRSACYVHAGKAAMRNREYTYVEGYASLYFPIPHAWIVDKDGLVIETTWSTMGTSYYGIPFRTDYIRQQFKKNGHYCMIDQWQDDWTTIRTPREKWLRNLPNQ